MHNPRPSSASPVTQYPVSTQTIRMLREPTTRQHHVAGLLGRWVSGCVPGHYMSVVPNRHEEWVCMPEKEVDATRWSDGPSEELEVEVEQS